MKLIMAVSKDGYVARSERDDMSWTGPSDKRAFQLLTSVGGVLACGSRTFGLMPPTLAGRRVVRIQRHGPMTLEGFASAHPDGWLIGGQTVAAKALLKGLVDQAFICRSDRSVFPTPHTGAQSFHLDGPYFHEGRAYNPEFERTHTIPLGDVRVECWRRRR